MTEYKDCKLGLNFLLHKRSISLPLIGALKFGFKGPEPSIGVALGAKNKTPMPQSMRK